MPTNRVRAVIWDWNGTLLDDVDQAWAAMNAVLAGLGLPELPDRDTYRAVFGFPIRDFYARLGVDVDSGGQFEAAARAYLSAYEATVVRARLQRGAREVLESLSLLGLEQVLISATPAPSLSRQLEPHGLGPLLRDVRGGSDDLAPSKAHVVSGWVASVEHQRADIVMVGDTDYDRDIAESLGLRFVGFDGGHQATAPDAEHPVIGDLGELVSLLGGSSGRPSR